MDCPFNISFHHTTGGVEALNIKNDSSNFQFTRRGFGVPIGMNYLDKQENVDGTLVLSYLYFNDVQLSVTRTPSEVGLIEGYTLKNNSNKPVKLNKEEYGIEMSFTDGTDIFEVALKRRLYVRVYKGDRMCVYTTRTSGGTSIGLILTDGELGGYTSDKYSKYSDTIYTFYPKEVELLPNEEYSFKWIIFPHNGIEGFRHFIGKYMPIPYFTTLTPSFGERVEVSFATVSLNGKEGNSFIAHNGAEVCISPIKETRSEPSKDEDDVVAVSNTEGSYTSNPLMEQKIDSVAESEEENIKDNTNTLIESGVIPISEFKEKGILQDEEATAVKTEDELHHTTHNCFNIRISSLDVLKMERDNYKRSIFSWKNPFDYLIKVREILEENEGEKGLQEASSILHDYYRGVGKKRFDCFIPIEVIKYDNSLRKIVHEKCLKLLGKQKGLFTPYRLLASYEYLLMEKELIGLSYETEECSEKKCCEQSKVTKSSPWTSYGENQFVKHTEDKIIKSSNGKNSTEWHIAIIEKLKELEELCNYYLDTPFGKIYPKSDVLTYILK